MVGRVSWPRAQRGLWTAFFLGPGLAYFLIFHLVPLFQSVVYSTQRWSLLTVRSPNRPFVGLENYRQVLEDPVFWEATRNTVTYTVFTVAGTVFLGLLLSLALLRLQPWLREVSKAILFLPVVVSLVGASVIWTWLFDYSFGLVNAVLGSVGIAPIPWLSDPAWAMPAVIITSVWKNLGFSMVIFLAGLLQIPAHLYEAAAIDGAGPWQHLRHVTLPLLRPTTLLVTVIQLIVAFQVFTQVYVMTRGGPGGATRVLVQYVVEQGFETYAMGKATAASLMLLVAVLVVSVVQFRLLGRETEA